MYTIVPADWYKNTPRSTYLFSSILPTVIELVYCFEQLCYARHLSKFENYIFIKLKKENTVAIIRKVASTGSYRNVRNQMNAGCAHLCFILSVSLASPFVVLRSLQRACDKEQGG